MKIGAHVSVREGADRAPLNAYAIGCECFQFFSRPPQGGPAPELTPEIIQKFKANCKKYKFTDYYIHTPYFINLASTNNRIKYGSIKVIREDLERGSLLGVKYVMTHVGSAKEQARTEAIKKVIDGLKKVLAGYQGKTELLIENSAGAGEIIGDDLREIKKIIKEFGLGVCLDTAHAFASGYKIENLLDEFEVIIGLAKLKLIHANDAKFDCGSRIDRHEHIGLGKIGKENFYRLLHDLRLKNINFILETPRDKRADDLENLQKLRNLRK